MTTMDVLINDIRNAPHALHQKDFLLTWDRSIDELKVILRVAEALRQLHRQGLSARLFDSGLAVSNFRDNSTRTRFSFASAANLLGLAVQDLDEGKSQIAHGETVRETATMISFLTEIIGIRDDMFLGAGHTYMLEVAAALEASYQAGVLPQRPGIVNLQCDIDHPTQSMTDLLWLEKTFGSLKALRGKKIAMTWAYSPSYGKPLSVPQGIIGLMSRFGMHVALAHPKGYDLIPEVVQMSARQAKDSGGSFVHTHSMEEAFEDADIVYPKSWASYSVMEKRTGLLRNNDHAGLKDLEKSCLAENAAHMHWECDAAKMKSTKGGKALYMHCLPADITGVSCKQGEVQADVFEEYRLRTYHEAGGKPLIIAAMMLANRFKDPAAALQSVVDRKRMRIG
jgi:knotted carbamoyltransferase YgeW